MNNTMNIVIYTILTGLIYLVSTFLLFYIGKLLYQLTHPRFNVKEELVEKDNVAFAIAHTGYYIGLLLAIGAAIVGPTQGLVVDLINIGIYGVMGLVLLNISVVINDKVILRKFSVHDEIIRDQNSGTGIVEAANAIGTGLIILGSITGEGTWYTALAFWAIGQVIIIITAYVYNWITPYDIHEHIEKDNVAAGIGFAGAIIAIANLIRAGLMHDFEGWQETLSWVGIEVVIGLLFLPLARWIADVILLPGQKLTDEIINQEKPNVGAGIIEAFAYVGGSFLISWCF
jgi:uncharacterized membrane protein YjfL (UPF0719 family)